MIAVVLTKGLTFVAAHWRALALSALVAFAGLQTARLEHAKADQYDRSACVAGQPCKPFRWRDEYRSAIKVAADARAQLASCKTNSDTLQAAIDRQGAATAALEASSASRVAQAARAAQAARSVAESARQTSNQLLEMRSAGKTDCERAQGVDQAFVEAIR